MRLAALLAVVGAFAGSGHHARLTASGIETLKVRGSGFHARERVRLTITPSTKHRLVRHVRTTRRSRFVVSFANVEACAGVSGVAAGSRGSHASFQYSSLVCG
jgi:hypothetical protein